MNIISSRVKKTAMLSKTRRQTRTPRSTKKKKCESRRAPVLIQPILLLFSRRHVFIRGQILPLRAPWIILFQQRFVRVPILVVNRLVVHGVPPYDFIVHVRGVERFISRIIRGAVLRAEHGKFRLYPRREIRDANGAHFVVREEDGKNEDDDDRARKRRRSKKRHNIAPPRGLFARFLLR